MCNSPQSRERPEGRRGIARRRRCLPLRLASLEPEERALRASIARSESFLFGFLSSVSLVNSNLALAWIKGAEFSEFPFDDQSEDTGP